MNPTLKNKLNPAIPFQMVNGVPVFADSIPCNNLYKPKGKNNPFGYGKKYSDWRKGQINRCIASHVYGEVLDNGGGYGDLKRYIDPRCKYFNYVIQQRRTDRHLFSFTSAFWRWFADRFIDEAKYGHCVFFVCKKL